MRVKKLKVTYVVTFVLGNLKKSRFINRNSKVKEEFCENLD